MTEYKKTSRRRDIARRQERKDKLSQVELEDTREIDAEQEMMDAQWKIQQEEMKDQIAWLIKTYSESFLEKCKNGDYKEFTRVPIAPFISAETLQYGICVCMSQRPLNLSHIVMANHIKRTISAW